MKNITNVLYSIGKENHHFCVASVVGAVPNEWTRRRTSKKRKLHYTIETIVDRPLHKPR